MHWASDKLPTPIFLKTDDDFAWPENERAFYLMTRDGLFLCRNHPFFRSSVRVEQWPAGLAAHDPLVKVNYPKIARRVFEQVVGFFSIIARRHGSEAIVLLAWNKPQERIEVIVPEQIGVVSQGWSGNAYPLELRYEIPPLPPQFMLIGDIHSHVDFGAYSSGLDKADEEFRPGLHMVVGRIQDEPPDFHCEVTVDGARFPVRDFNTVVTGYQRRRETEVPEEWIARVAIKSWTSVKTAYLADESRSCAQTANTVFETQEAVVTGQTAGEPRPSLDSASAPPPPNS